WPFPSDETEFQKGVRHITRRDVHETYLALSFPGPPISSPRDVIAMDLLTVILGSGRSSRLTQRLREQLGLVEEIGMSFSTHKAPGLAYVYALMQENNLDNAINEIVSTIHDLIDRPPSELELAKAKRIIRNDVFYTTETTSGQTSLLGYYMTLTNSDEFYQRYLPLVESTSVSDLLCVAQSYLTLFEPVVLAAVPAESASSEVSHASS
ncbi:MAG: insulinase family protein, partial [Candidatus Sumerlaeaceae bacterium]|nr:insulinase family protein [Candidatus Sumerlaeaceae bacterium]